MAVAAPNEPERPVLGSPRKRRNGVRKSLTPRNQREASDLGDMMARMLRALSRRAEGGDLEALIELVKLDRVLALEQLRAAHALNTMQGYSWAQIALRLGITRQSAHGRWGLH